MPNHFPSVESIPEESDNALKAGWSLHGAPSKRPFADGFANCKNTTEKNCLRTPPASIASCPQIDTRNAAWVSNLLRLYCGNLTYELTYS